MFDWTFESSLKCACQPSNNIYLISSIFFLPNIKMWWIFFPLCRSNLIGIYLIMCSVLRTLSCQSKALHKIYFTFDMRTAKLKNLKKNHGCVRICMCDFSLFLFSSSSAIKKGSEHKKNRQKSSRFKCLCVEVKFMR